MKKLKSQEGELLSKILGPWMKVGLPLMKNVLTTLAKSVLIRLRLSARVPATNAAIQKEIYGSGMTTLIISYK